MAKAVMSPPSFIGTPIPSLSHHSLHTLPQRRLITTRGKFSFLQLNIWARRSISTQLLTEQSLLYTLADAVVAVDSAFGGATSGSADSTAQKSGGWVGFISDAMEVVLKVHKQCSQQRARSMVTQIRWRKACC